MKIWTLPHIQQAFDADRAVAAVKQGFIAFSNGLTQTPPVQHLRLAEVEGECCVKSAYVDGKPVFGVKVSSGFYRNHTQGLPSNHGLMLLCCAATGAPLHLLLDEGWLTSIRTAIAGQLAARTLAPLHVHGIGVVGTGDQARLQLQWLKPVTDCRRVWVWGRRRAQSEVFAREMSEEGFTVSVCEHPRDVLERCNLVVTTTPAREPLLNGEWVRPGTHITAVGADGPGKQELDARILARAGTVVVDSTTQCSQYGEAAHALASRLITPDRLRELGNVLAHDSRARNDEDVSEITVADLTGVAVQDAQIAWSVVSDSATRNP